MGKYRKEDCCYEEMANGGKDGGQSITKVDNSIHSGYHDAPMVNAYEDSRKSHYGKNGIDWSAMRDKA